MKFKTLLFILFIPKLFFSQNFNFFKESDESFIINTNDNTFLAGETLFYDVHVKNTKDTLNSKIIYIELVDKNNENTLRQEKENKTNSIYGDIFIQTHLKTGIYKLIVFSKKSLLQTKNKYNEIEISIINPYQSNILFIEDILPQEKKSKTINILNKTKFRTREKIDFKLPDFNTEKVSVSVKRLNNFLEIKKTDSKNSQANDSQTSNFNLKQLPEIRGKIISGKILNYQNTDQITNYVSLSINKTISITKISSVSSDGRFIFLLEKPIFENEILIQPLFKTDKFEIILDKINFDYNLLNWENKLIISKKYLNQIYERSIANQIEVAYYNSKKDTISEHNNQEYFYSKNFREIQFNDFTKFNTIKDLLVEIIDGVSTKKIEGINYIFIYNQYTNLGRDLPALTLLNGTIVQDYEILFNLNAKKINKVQIVDDNYYLGPKLYNGIINFITDENLIETNFSPYIKIEIQPTLIDKKYYKESYLNSNKQNIPDQRFHLYWNSNLNKNSIDSFYTSDIEGDFIFEITTIDKHGHLEKYTQNFEVKK